MNILFEHVLLNGAVYHIKKNEMNKVLKCKTCVFFYNLLLIQQDMDDVLVITSDLC